MMAWKVNRDGENESKVSYTRYYKTKKEENARNEEW
jgi:hypothetical protein